MQATLLLLLCLWSWQWTAAAATTSTSSDACELSISPASVIGLTVGRYQRLQLNCTCCHELARQGFRLATRALVANAQIVAVTATGRRERQQHPTPKRNCDGEFGGDLCTAKDFPYGSSIYIEANNVGRTAALLRLLAWNASSVVETNPSAPEEIVLGGQHSTTAVAQRQVPVVTLRKPRLIDAAFDWAIGLVACTLALCMGCITDLRQVRPYFTNPLSLVCCLLVQHALLPPTALGLYKAFGLEEDTGLGLVAIATMPGGGLAHLTVYLMEGDRNLSAAISLMNALLNLGLSPAWLGLLSRWLGFRLRLHLAAIWLLPLFGVQMTGALLATCRPSLAQAVLNWAGRPLLLLAAILMVTLGIYINHYAIDHLEARALCCVLAFIGAAFSAGGLAGLLAKQAKPLRKAMAAEAAASACLIAIPAMRSACDPPTSDLATVLPLAAAILTPAPIVIYVVAHRVKGWVGGFIDKRKEKQSRQFSIVSSLARMAEDVTAVSAPLAIEEAAKEAGAKPAATEKQKVTTL